MSNPWFAAVSCTVALGACAPPGTGGGSGDGTRSARQSERWSSDGDPGLLAHDLARIAGALPASGEAATSPWAGSYWPSWKDSINHRWAGADTPSPAEKYQLAFGGEGVEDKVSETEGIDSFEDAKACTKRKDCASGEACGKRRGAASGRCVPTWYGLCDGWAAAAILFPEPVHAVVRHGVTFEVQDIKALLTLVSTVAVSRSTSGRCEEIDKRGEMEHDADGRPAPACRDTNPGTLHVLLGNYLGLRGEAFVADRAFDQEVWNHPIRRYHLETQEVVTPEEANRLVEGGAEAGDPPGAGYRFDADAASLLHVKNDVSYVMESAAGTDGNLSADIDVYTTVVRYEYVLELDGDGAVIGGEWVGDSKREHPDFLWSPIHSGSDPVAGGAISLSRVRALATASIAPEP